MTDEGMLKLENEMTEIIQNSTVLPKETKDIMNKIRELKCKLEAISAYMESEEFLHGDCLVSPTARIKKIIGG